MEHFLDASNILNDWRRVSFYKIHMQSTPHNKWQNLTELRVIRATAGGRAKLAFQPRSLSQISQNQAQKVKIPNI
jgi:hypothetical protein